jgi:hypothetical protein
MVKYLVGLIVVAALLVGVVVATRQREHPPEGPAPSPNKVSVPADAARPSPDGSLRDPLADMRELIATAVAAGYEDRAHITESAAEVFGEDMRGHDVEQIAARMVDDALAVHRKREEGWKAPTDCDRLDRAFEKLEHSGIVARQNFSDCGTCGAAEIEDEMQAARKQGRKVRGYVFFHEQDAEGAVDGSLYLSYGARADDQSAHLAIAREVVDVLKRAGLDANWNGRHDTRIGVKLEWKKRRFTKTPPG